MVECNSSVGQLGKVTIMQKVFVMFKGPMTETCHKDCEVVSTSIVKEHDGRMRPHAEVKSPFGLAKAYGETYDAKFINEQWFVYLD